VGLQQFEPKQPTDAVLEQNRLSIVHAQLGLSQARVSEQLGSSERSSVAA
jgi:hypothetical protein